VVRARCQIEHLKGNRSRIIVSEIPYQQYRDRVIEKIAALVNGDRIKGISGIRDESDLNEPVRLVIDIKRDADPDVVLNQLYQFSPLQDSFSLILLALVDGKPRELTLKELMSEFVRHRVTVIRRRTQFLLNRARRRKHFVEGLLLALANIDEIIRIIRSSSTQAEAKTRLMDVECPSSMLQRALGDKGFEQFTLERGGVQDTYTLTSVQADAILRMTLGQLVNLEQQKLGDEHAQLLEEITGYIEILSDQSRIYGIIREDMEEAKRRFGDKRRTEISGEELGNIDLEDLITEETMVVTISHRGYIKRTPSSTYRAQKRGGKGMKGAKTEDEDPIQHLFVASTHAYLLFITNSGKVYWQKVYDLPQLARESRGRAIVNLLNLSEGEQIAQCLAVRDFDQPGHFIMMSTRSGLVKKTTLESYSRPKKGGIIAIKLREGDELVDAAVIGPGSEVVLVTSQGMAIRFSERDARPMGRNTSGVKGISLGKGDAVVGMVVADPEATLLTVCERGYGKRTFFGPNAPLAELPPLADADETVDGVDGGDAAQPVAATEEESKEEPKDEVPEEEIGEESASGSARYRTQRRGGKGLRDIRTSARNGKVISIVTVNDDDEILMMTARGKIQRIAARDINVIGRNTQGVRIMSLDEQDNLVAVVHVPPEDDTVGEIESATVIDTPPRVADFPSGQSRLSEDDFSQPEVDEDSSADEEEI
jgi:DNA gyrase subunit A